jgi:hypothetical protein
MTSQPESVTPAMTQSTGRVCKLVERLIKVFEAEISQHNTEDMFAIPSVIFHYQTLCPIDADVYAV